MHVGVLEVVGGARLVSRCGGWMVGGLGWWIEDGRREQVDATWSAESDREEGKLEGAA